MSYREVALVNGALWIGRGRSGEEAREAFEAVLREFPESGFAKISKRMMFANDTHRRRHYAFTMDGSKIRFNTPTTYSTSAVVL